MTLPILKRLSIARDIVLRGASDSLNAAVAWFERTHGQQTGGGPSDPYEQVVAYFRCVQFLSESVAYMPLMVATADDRILESGPIADLLDRPNAKQSIEEFVQQTVGWLYAGGEGVAYWIFTARQGGRPTEIIVAGTPQCRPRYTDPSGRGEPIGYSYRPAGKQWSEALPLELGEVWPLRIPAYDADRPARGVSIVGVARKAVNQVYKSDVANEASLDNGVEPGGALKTPNNLTDDQRRNLKEFIAEHHAGSANRRRLMLLEGGLEWQQMAASFKDMEFADLKKFSRADVCAAFGLDPSAVGFPPEGGRFEYAKAAEDKAWISRVLPLARWIAGNFDRGVLQHYEADQSIAMQRSLQSARRMHAGQRAIVRRAARPGRRRLYAWFDATVVEAVKELIASRTETAAKMVRDLKATPADAIELFDLGLEINPWQRYGWQSSTEMMIVASADPESATREPDGPGADDPPGGGEEDELDLRLRRLTALTDELDSQDKAAIPEEQREAYWRGWRSTFRALEPRFRRLFREHMKALGDECVANLQRVAPAELRSLNGVERRDLIGTVLFDLVAADGKLLASLGPLVRAAAQSGGDSVMAEAADARGEDEPDVFNIADPEAKRILQQRRIAITDLNARAAQRLRQDLARGLDAGQTTQELAETIRQRFRLESNKARTIAYQELSTSVEESRAVARDQAQVPLKSWLWSRKETGRRLHAFTETHYMANPIPNAERFELGGPGTSGIRCDHPRSTGLAEQDINCGCTVISRFANDNPGRALARCIRAFETVARKGQRHEA